MVQIEDRLLKALTCLNPKEQKAYNSLPYWVVASEKPSVQSEEE